MGTSSGCRGLRTAQRPRQCPRLAPGGLLCGKADGMRVREGQARADREGVETRAPARMAKRGFHRAQRGQDAGASGPRDGTGLHPSRGEVVASGGWVTMEGSGGRGFSRSLRGRSKGSCGAPPTPAVIRAAASSTSASVVNRDRPNRRLARAWSSSRPRASSTWLGRGILDEQALPDDTASPSPASVARSVWPSTPGTWTLRLLTSRVGLTVAASRVERRAVELEARQCRAASRSRADPGAAASRRPRRPALGRPAGRPRRAPRCPAHRACRSACPVPGRRRTRAARPAPPAPPPHVERPGALRPVALVGREARQIGPDRIDIDRHPADRLGAVDMEDPARRVHRPRRSPAHVLDHADLVVGQEHRHEQRARAEGRLADQPAGFDRADRAAPLPGLDRAAA